MLKQTTKENIKIGTTLFLVPSSCSSHDKPHDITITKIGRKYAYFGNRDTKIDLATMQVERDYRGIKPELWDSKEAYESSVERSKVISECRSYFTSTDITKRKKLTYKKAVKILAILNDESEVKEKEVTKTLTQDVFKGAPEWANFLVVNAYGIGFFTDVSPYLATWRAANGWVQSSYSKGLIAFAGRFDVDDWQKFKLKRLIGSE